MNRIPPLPFFPLGACLLISLVCPHRAFCDEGFPPEFRSREGALMVFIPGGEFVMGSTGEEGLDDERPQHLVRIAPFYLDKYEASNALYALFDPGHHFPEGEENLPVTMVSWDRAAAFAKWAGKRLPTEAEWEYAATGGEGFRFPWGSDWDPARLNWSENGERDGFDGPAPVDAFPQGVSPFGVFNMSGNVWEWVSDWYGPYPSDSSSSPSGSDSGTRRGLRGGAWDIGLPAMHRCRYREARWPRHRHDAFGFRCAVDADKAYPSLERGSSFVNPTTPSDSSN
jgi:formylglycine-generating enzyme required for sulfatase activity